MKDPTLVRFQLSHDKRCHAEGIYDDAETRFDYTIDVTLTKPFKIGRLKYRKGETYNVALGEVLSRYDEKTKKWIQLAFKELYSVHSADYTSDY